MSKELVNIDGHEVLVREDTAKRLRGVHWAFFTLVMMIVIAGILFFAGVFKMASNDLTPAANVNSSNGTLR